MRIIKKIFVFLLVLVSISALAAYIFIKTFDLNKVKPQILAEARKALSREVNFDKISLAVSLRQGLSVQVNNLLIADDPAFGKAGFLSVKNIFVRMDVLGYILQKRVVISGIFIDSPRLVIIRNKDGSLNVQTIAHPAAIGKEASVPAQLSVPAIIPAVFISSLKGSNGVVTYIDRSFDPPVRLEINGLNFDLSQVSLTEAFPFFVEAAVLSAEKNFKVKGNLRVDLKTNDVTVTDLKAMCDFSGIQMEKIPVSFPMIKSEVLPSQMEGILVIALQQLTAGPQEIAFFPADVSWSQGSMKFKELASPVTHISLLGVINEKKIIVTKLFCSLGGGSINGSAVVNDYLTAQEFDIEAVYKDLKVEDLVSSDKTPVKAEGVVSGKLKFQGKGVSPEALKETLSGSVDLSVTSGKLRDINVLRTVLDKLSIIPGLSKKVEDGLPGSYRKILTQEDTVLSDMYLSFVIADGRLVLKDTVLGANEFMYKGSGEFGFDGTYALDGSFLIPAELSTRMVESVSDLGFLLNEDKQIYIPLKVSGKVGEPKFKVNIEYISKKLVTDQAKQQIFKAIDKYLGPKEEASSPANQTAPETTQSDTSQKVNTKDAINSILDKLLKK
ncbi:MAG: AsmA family protein [Candidatus Omnitrophota bacterium]|jgi:hypothetical protein